MSPRHNLADCYLVDPTARLRVWTVDAIPVARSWCPEDPFPVRVPAYTAAEAAQVAASMSGLPREEWSAYFFIPSAHEEEG